MKCIDDIVQRAIQLPNTVVAAVIHPCSDVVLASAINAKNQGIIRPILVGVIHKIEDAARQAGVSLKDVDIVDVPHSHAAVEKAAELVRQGTANLIVKGSVHTDEMMGILVKAEQNMRTDRRMSHVFVMQVEKYSKLLMVTDAALNVEPDLKTKRDIVQNAIDLAHALSILKPKVAVLSAQENVKPQLPSTIDAAALCKMLDRGQITGALMDGPLAFDNAINQEAAQMKGIKSEVAGEADILITPDLESGNMLAKQLIYLADAKSAGLVMGAKVPIVLTSRAEKEEGRLQSLALGALVGHHKLMQQQAKPVK